MQRARDDLTGQGRLAPLAASPDERTRVMSLPVVDPNLCTACGICVDECPQTCYDLEDMAKLNRPDDCTECGICVDACPNGAISMD